MRLPTHLQLLDVIFEALDLVLDLLLLPLAIFEDGLALPLNQLNLLLHLSHLLVDGPAVAVHMAVFHHLPGQLRQLVRGNRVTRVSLKFP